MKCDRARLLIGVHDELDQPALRALQAHLRVCPGCRTDWLDEEAFRRQVAGRPPAPAPSPGHEVRLLAIPTRNLGYVRWRLALGRLGPAAIAVLILAIGLLWLAQVRQEPPGAAERPLPPEVIVAAATPIARQGAVTRQRAPLLEAAVPPAAAPAPAVGLAAAPAPQVSLIAAAVAAPLSPGAFQAPDPRADAAPAPAAAPPSSGPAGGPAIPPPTSVAATPTVAPPSPTAATPTWSILVEVYPDVAGGEVRCPGCDRRYEEADRRQWAQRAPGAVLLEVLALGEGYQPLFEEWVGPEADGVVRRRLQLAVPPPYQVAFVDAQDEAYELCPRDQAVKVVTPADLVAGEAVLAFWLWAPECRPAPEPTATPGTAPTLGGGSFPSP
jgi:hypothetical protein